jgi:putative redox protein
MEGWLKTARISETSAGGLQMQIDVSGYTWTGDEPVDEGGTGKGPNPYDLLLASLGACTAMTVRVYARQRAWPLDGVSVIATHEMRKGAGDAEHGESFVQVVHLQGENLSLEQRIRLLDVAGRCPVHRTITGKPSIVTKLG